MFPNQDTLPKDKKLGNLIALPLQRGPGKAGNSLFVDDHLEPYRDQWQFLSSLRKMKRMEAEALVDEAQRKGSVIRIARASDEEDDEPTPWTAAIPREDAWEESFPTRMKLIISDKLYIEKEGLTSSQINAFIRLAAFQNPDFYKAQKMRLSTFGKPRIINCSAEFSRHIALPRGCLESVLERLESRGTTVELSDERVTGQPLQIDFRAELKAEQSKAAAELLRYAAGILAATTAFGKTVIGAWMIAARGVSTLVLVHRRQLLEQWKAQLALFLTIPADEIGQWGGGKNSRTGRLDVAMLQSVHGREDLPAVLGEYGQIIVDECHHISAFSFEQVLSSARSKYVLGLTATYVRKDGHHPIVSMQCGPVRYRVDAKAQAKSRPFRHVLLPRSTAFSIPEAEAADLSIQELYDRLIADERRNDQIFDDLLKALDQGRSPLLMAERTAHLDYFAERLKPFAKNVIVLRGGMGKKRWRDIQEQIRSVPDNQERVFLATGRFAGEGFDDARLDTLFLVMPISWKGTLQQYAGRLHRMYESKREVQIYDYVDQEVPKLMRMYAKRRKGYLAMGYSEEART